MKELIEGLNILDSYLIDPVIIEDETGLFIEWRSDPMAAADEQTLYDLGWLQVDGGWLYPCGL